jgi:hypothetical protein
LISALFVNPAKAFCPVCTVAVGAGLGISKVLGIDDVISGVWIGGLTLSMSLWTINFLDGRKIRFLFRKPLILFLMYALVIVPLQWANLIGIPYNTLWGVDKIILGTIIGSAGFALAMVFNNILLKSNNGKVFFPFQKVAVPLLTLNIINLIFYLILY